jgi:hypothetical protein
MTDREYVESKWEGAILADHAECCGPFKPYCVSFGNGSQSSWEDTPEAAWSAARKFTEQRLEAIRLVEEEVGLISGIMREDFVNQKDCRTYKCFARILAARQAALDEMKRNMRVEEK